MAPSAFGAVGDEVAPAVKEPAVVADAPVADAPAAAGGAEDVVPDDGAPAAGKELFISKCSSCHTVGKGDRVGPDLKGVGGRRAAGWLTKMVQTPSQLLDSDADAIALVTKFKVRMPDLGLSTEQTANVIDLLTYCSGQVCDLSPKLRPITSAVPADIERGGQIFVGVLPLENGGPACISCHTIDGMDSMMAGGTLAKDLSHSYARLGDGGLDAALKSPSFALMNKIFADHPLTADEVFALRAVLYDANRGVTTEHTVTPWSVPLASSLGALLALVLLNAAWSRRMRGVRQHLVSQKGQ